MNIVARNVARSSKSLCPFPKANRWNVQIVEVSTLKSWSPDLPWPVAAPPAAPAEVPVGEAAATSGEVNTCIRQFAGKKMLYKKASGYRKLFYYCFAGRDDALL
jgi:hypothetical protein